MDKKVLLVNGSPHEHGCTYTALEEIAKTLAEEGVDTDFYWIGNKPIGNCLGCHRCNELGRCVVDFDDVNAFSERAKEYDGFFFGSPVHYSGITGNMKNFMDRAFYSVSRISDNPYFHKPVGAVVSARRAGTTRSLDQLNQYFGHELMPIISSRYWNMVHGNTPDEVRKDEEGLQVMRYLAREMAWFLAIREAGEKAGIRPPEPEDVRITTNYIR